MNKTKKKSEPSEKASRILGEAVINDARRTVWTAKKNKRHLSDEEVQGILGRAERYGVTSRVEEILSEW